MEAARTVNDDIAILPSYVPLPGYGMLPVNAFVLKAHEPVLIDTGLHADSDAFIATLREVIDPQDLRWLVLTHPDQDHVGSLATLMREAPQLQLVTTFIGYGIITLFEQIALDRVYLLNPGEALDLGDRTLSVLRPPSYDNPATCAFFDSKSRALFSSDCFGGLVQAPADAANDIARDELVQGCTVWGTVDAPWLHNIDRAKFAAQLKDIADMEPSVVLSSHLPPAHRITELLLATLAGVPEATQFVGPNQAALEQMLRAMTQPESAAIV